MTEVQSLPVESTPQPQKRAAIIDDAFDDVTEGEISFTEFKKFYQIASSDDRWEPLLTRLEVKVPEIEDWDDDAPEFHEFLKKLWANKQDVELLEFINSPHLFANKINKLKALELFCKNIEGQNVAVEKFPSKIENYSVFEEGKYLYIFLDYRLGVNDDAQAVNNAKKVARNIYEAYGEGRKPVTIIMSADATLNESIKDEFRGEGMLDGVFRFSPKSDLGSESKVSLLVRAYNEEFGSNHKLQHYIEALVNASEQAQRDFVKEIRSLRIEDYEFIHNGVLLKQQQPLGDYLAWLYGTHWASLLFQDPGLKEAQNAIDKVVSEKAPLHHTKPTENISTLFMTALFEQGLDDVEFHPMGNSKLPYLHLGDVFTKSESQDVYMVINPQCDLERPDEKKKGQSILLLPGTLNAVAELGTNEEMRTDFFVFDEKWYQIKWHVRYLTSVVYGDFEEWKKGKDVERRYRLRLPYALNIQQQLSANISRVGLPVAPPLSQTLTVEVLRKGPDDALLPLIGRGDDYAFWPITRDDKQSIRLTLKLALDLKAALVEEVRRLKLLLGTFSDGAPKTYQPAIQKLEEFIANFDTWFFDNRKIQHPGTGIKPLPKVNAHIKADLKEDEYPKGSLFVINIVIKPKVEEPKVVEGEIIDSIENNVDEGSENSSQQATQTSAE